MLEDRLTATEQEIREIRKVVTHRLNTLEKECQACREIRKAITQAEQDVKLDFSVELDFTCSLCSVTKPIDQRERKGKQKSSVCKQCANNRLKERRKKSRGNGTSRYECVCGSIFQRWGLTKHEQTIKHKNYIKSLGLEENEEEEDETNLTSLME